MRKAGQMLKGGDHHFDVPIENLCRSFPPNTFSYTAIFYNSPYLTPHHLNGAMEGSLLTLVSGRKEWTIYSPDGKNQYIIHQEPGQTVYVPPGYSHEVKSTSNKSMAYGAMWKSSTEQKVTTLCQNRNFIRNKMINEHRKGLANDLEEYVKPTQKGVSAIDKVLKSAGRLRAIQKGGPTRRYKDGRKRKCKITIKKKKNQTKLTKDPKTKTKNPQECKRRK
jgi:hypothetical protein